MRAMGWVENEAENLTNSEREETGEVISGTVEARKQARWHDLLRGFERDVDEFKRTQGSANFIQSSETECRVSNSSTKIAVRVTVDLPGEAIRYEYHPEDNQTAVPESGILTMRESENQIELFSADQRLTLEQARKLILHPLLFPDRPEDLRATG
jgi:hypothetical protein